MPSRSSSASTRTPWRGTAALSSPPRPTSSEARVASGQMIGFHAAQAIRNAIGAESFRSGAGAPQPARARDEPALSQSDTDQQQLPQSTQPSAHALKFAGQPPARLPPAAFHDR